MKIKEVRNIDGCEKIQEYYADNLSMLHWCWFNPKDTHARDTIRQRIKANEKKLVKRDYMNKDDKIIYEEVFYKC